MRLVKTVGAYGTGLSAKDAPEVDTSAAKRAILSEKGSLQNISNFGKRLARQFLKAAYILGLKMTLASVSAHRPAPFSDRKQSFPVSDRYASSQTPVSQGTATPKTNFRHHPPSPLDS